MNKFASLLYTVAVVVGVAVAAYTAITFLDLKRQEVTNEARFQCAQSSRYQVAEEDNGVTTWYPAAELYAACLREKGI